MDHVIPYAEGGPTSSDNIGPLCRPAPPLKSTTPVGATPSWNPVQPGPRRTATSTCATAAAPPTSPATKHRRPARPVATPPHTPRQPICEGPRHVSRADRTPGTAPHPPQPASTRVGVGGSVPAGSSLAGSVKGGMSAPECATTADAVADTATQRLRVATRQCRTEPDPRDTTPDSFTSSTTGRATTTTATARTSR